MYLDDRKIKILQAIVDDYINTAEPVGSRTVSKKYDLGLSSATIRNEMADLEEMGYLEQPHTSAGRVPSDIAYRLYVDRLMRLHKLTRAEADSIKQSMDIKIHEINELLKQASNVISKITRYTALATAPELNKSTIKLIQLVPLEYCKIIVVLVTNSSTLRNNIVTISKNVTTEFLDKASKLLTEKLQGLTIDVINLPLIEEIKKSLDGGGDIVSQVLSVLSDSIAAIDGSDIYLGGTTNIFNYPEYNDIAKAREFLSFLETRQLLHRLVDQTSLDESIDVAIGRENKVLEAKDCTLVTATYSYGNKVIGKIGIIGPTRMEYSRVITSLEYIRKIINTEIMRVFGEE